ncbi:MAG: AGE family epimerase/isomerase [Planctomycetota bacterium]|jgi:mannose/cellobiose epimerase-like protein (N-acyl-D-glucosamine 2-epimerase family)
MKRREFLQVTAAAGLANPTSAFAKGRVCRRQPGPETQLPNKIDAMTLTQLRDDCYGRLFNKYLPFWDKGGYDKELGGFMCELNEDGSVHNDQKDSWYQGRGIWVYSFLYNNFGGDKRFLEIAGKSRDFMVKHMYAGNGNWIQLVRRDGRAIKSDKLNAQGSSADIFGALFVAAGLAEYYKATGDKQSLELAKISIAESIKRYERPNYLKKGLRTMTCSFMLVWTLSQFLSCSSDAEFEKVAAEHVDALISRFWNPKYEIMNSELNHDYSRIPSTEGLVRSDHTIESLWMVMFEAVRTKDRKVFDLAASRFRRVLEMGWDYVFDGYASSFSVFGDDGHVQGGDFELKKMWTHSEILIGCLSILEYTGQIWTADWYARARRYILKTMATDFGIWRQAVDRFGKPKDRAIVSAYRRGNFHQPRCLMLNLLSLNRMIKNKGSITEFPV